MDLLLPLRDPRRLQPLRRRGLRLSSAIEIGSVFQPNPGTLCGPRSRRSDRCRSGPRRQGPAARRRRRSGRSSCRVVTSREITQADAARKWGVERLDGHRDPGQHRQGRGAGRVPPSRPGRPVKDRTELGVGGEARRTGGSPRRSRPRRVGARCCCGEFSAGPEFAPLPAACRRDQARADGPQRRRGGRRRRPHLGVRVLGSPMTGYTAGGSPAPGRHAGGPGPRRCRGPPPLGRGRIDAILAVEHGVGRPVAPQARPPRLLPGPGVGVAFHVPAGSGCSPPSAARPPARARAPGSCARAGLGPEPAVVLGRHSLPPGPPGSVRHRRRREPPLGRPPARIGEETSTQVQVLFDRALTDQGLLDRRRHAADRRDDAAAHPVGLVRQRRPDDLHRHARVHGARRSPSAWDGPDPDRPGVGRELLQSPQGRWPHLTSPRPRRARQPSWPASAPSTTGSVCTPASAMSPPTTNTRPGPPIRRARPAGLTRPEPRGSSTIGGDSHEHRRHHRPHRPQALG